MEHFTIKRLQPTDIAQAKELIEAWQKDGFALKNPLPADDYLHRLIADGEFHVIVAMVNDKVVGGITAYELVMFDKEETEMFLYDIAVAKGHRNKSIAKELIAELKKICSEKGIKIMFVGTTPDNEAAKQLYLTTGAQREIISWFTYDLEKEA